MSARFGGTSCPDGVSLARYLLLPDNAVPVKQAKDRVSAASLDQALQMLSGVGYTEAQLAEVRAYLSVPELLPVRDDQPVAVAAD